MKLTAREKAQARKITDVDRRRYQLYLERNIVGGWMYSLNDIAKIERISRESLYESLWKFPDYTPREPKQARKCLT